MRWQRTANLTLFAVSLLLAVGACELMVRWLFAYVSTTGGQRSYFPERFYALHPPQRNRLGFRERESAPSQDGAAYRIAIVGDSFTFELESREEQGLSNLLEQRLNEGGRDRFEVLDFSTPGLHPPPVVRQRREQP
jgi:hypothetical protein